MSKFMLGKKAGMTQLFDEAGNAVPVTVIDCGPLVVLQKKTEAVDGYSAVKVGFDEKPAKNVNRPDKGQFKAADTTSKRVLQEFHTDADDQFEIGQTLNVADMFAPGDAVDVSGRSKGKGFQGNVKRHGQAGGLEAHGSKYHRRVGSLGSSATPGRTMPGTKLPGQMGNKNVTVQNLDVVLVDGERNILALKGAVPGSNGTYLTITATVKSGKKA